MKKYLLHNNDLRNIIYSSYPKNVCTYFYMQTFLEKGYEYMKVEIKKQIEEVFETNKGYARTKDILSAGIDNKKLNILENEGLITKIKRGLYKWNDYDFENELSELTRIVPEAVVCLLSALSYHNLTTNSPWQHHVAIRRDFRKPVLPKYPPIKLYYFSLEQYEAGIEEIIIDGVKIKIYNREKTICDCVRYRNKIGIDIVKEALTDYLREKDRNINKLLEYAKICRVYGIIKEYLGVLV